MLYVRGHVSFSHVTGLFHGFYMGGTKVLHTYSGVSSVLQVCYKVVKCHRCVTGQYSNTFLHSCLVLNYVRGHMSLSHVTMLFHGCYRGGAEVLQWCFSSVSGVLQICYMCVTVVLQGCYRVIFQYILDTLPVIL